MFLPRRHMSFYLAAIGGARGRTDVPKIVDWYMDGKINPAFDLMHEGKSIRSVIVY